MKQKPNPPEPVHKFRYPFPSPTEGMPRKAQIGERVVTVKGVPPPRKSDGNPRYKK